MNENLKASYVEALLIDYEKGPSDGSVPLSENGAALAPYVCPGGELTIGYGNTKWFDGEDVQQFHRLSGEDEALALLRQSLPYYEDGVRKHLTREATPWQFSAMVALAYNIGLAAFAGSSVLTSFNAGRMEDAAANFGKWTGATCDRPPRWLRNKPEFAAYVAAGKVGEDHKRNIRWVGPDGQYCRYMLRYVGSMDRHYAEALMFMGKDHRPTLRSATPIELSLTPTPPSQAQWNPTKGRWEDGVADKTSFKAVLERAWYDKLPETLSDPTTSKAAPAAGASGPAGQPALPPNPAPAGPATKPAAPASPSVAAGPATLPKAPQAPSASPAPVPAKPALPPVVAGQDGAKPPHAWTKQVNDVHYRVDPNAGAKPLEYSERGIGFFWQRLAMGVIYLGCSGCFGSGMKGFSDLMTSSAPLMSIFLDLTIPILVSLTVALVGLGLKSYGDWRRRRGEARASQLLY